MYFCNGMRSIFCALGMINASVFDENMKGRQITLSIDL